MWALQKTTGDDKGAWSWLRFGNEPWEADDSQFYGASLAAVAVGVAPQDYRSAPEIRKNLELLRDYLLREYRSPGSTVIGSRKTGGAGSNISRTGLALPATTPVRIRSP